MSPQRSGGVLEGALVLADGSVFEGELLGAVSAGGVASGEVVFNTAMSGYQEIITDPSYAGQIITFTTSHVGIYGVNLADFEARRPFCRGVIVRDLARRRSSWRSAGDLDALLGAYGIGGIGGVDTRRLTRLVRSTGAIPGAFGDADEQTLLAAARAEPGTDGVDLVATVTTSEPYLVRGNPDGFTIVAFDFGIKRTILRHLARFGNVHVVPASTSASDALALAPDGIFLSNGPGDPACVPDAVDTIRALLVDGVPIFGICLGHQLLARALGAETVKLKFGHHGANHPVMNLRSGVIEITSQNHNFAVDADSLASAAAMTHVNLNDNVCEGIAASEANAFGVQHHPEAGPGPHDSSYLFGEFAERMARHAGRARYSITATPLEEPHGLPEPDSGVA
jgi:carbamoyl-phosphate synthase small subunit